MRVKIQISYPTPSVANIPCDDGTTVKQLKETITKRIGNLSPDFELHFDGGKLFDEDTLGSLGIKEGDTIEVKDPAAGATSAPANATAAAPSAPSATPTTTPTTPSPVSTSIIDSKSEPPAVKEVVMVCFDISSSMDATFIPDTPVNISRLAAAKVCFGAFVDKTIAFEYPHAMGLICFGKNVHEKLLITRELNNFESIFGDVTQTEPATHLYPAVRLAIQRITQFKSLISNQNCKYRVICFTDGGDNSNTPAYQVALEAIQAGVTVDAVIVGGTDSDHQNLRSLAHCTAGISVRIPMDRPSLSVIFEQEPVLALSERDMRPFPTKTISKKDFEGFSDLQQYPYVGVTLKEVQKKEPTAVTAKASKNVDTVTSVTTPAAVKRIMSEYKSFQVGDAPTDTEAFMAENDAYSWKIIIKGRDGTPYAGGYFLLMVTFPQDYPFRAPTIKFVTPIYHCNINDAGRICMDMMAHTWSPTITMPYLVEGILTLMRNPNPLDALDGWKGALYQTDQQQYLEQAKLHTLQHATIPLDELKKRYNLS